MDDKEHWFDSGKLAVAVSVSFGCNLAHGADALTLVSIPFVWIILWLVYLLWVAKVWPALRDLIHESTA